MKRLPRARFISAAYRFFAYGGDPLPVHIEETGTNYVIGWQGRYCIDGDAFIYEDNESRRLSAI